MTMTGPTAEEVAEIRDVARRVVVEEVPLSRVREITDGELVDDPALWRFFAELGWTGLGIPSDYGGSDGSFLELAVILGELGRHVVPSAMLSTVALGAPAILVAGTAHQKQDYLPRVAGGDLRIAPAVTGRHGRPDASDVEVTARTDVGDLLLTGFSGFVLDAVVADLLLVAAHDDEAEGLSLFVIPADRPGIAIERIELADPTRPTAGVRFDDVPVAPTDVLGTRGGADPLLASLAGRAAAAIAIDSVGGAERVLETTVDYAKQRFQFGRAIGSFQAIKHHCANMLVRVEAARAAADAAVRASHTGDAVDAEWMHIAKAYCADGYSEVSRLGVQIHGGIGFTWECDLHFYLKRARLNQQLFGNSTWHRARLMQRIVEDRRSA